MLMSISELYSKCHIPPNLQRHMLEVAAVAKAVCDHWVGDPVDSSLIVTVALIHDLGNLIKFKQPFLGELEQDAEFWSQKQDEMRQKFEGDVHTATIALAKQGTFSEEVLEELDRTGQTGLPAKFSTNEARIIELADMCVSPAGIVGPETRINDLLIRYGDQVHMVDIDRHRENIEIVSGQLDQTLQVILNSISKENIELLRDLQVGG